MCCAFKYMGTHTLPRTPGQTVQWVCGLQPHRAWIWPAAWPLTAVPAVRILNISFWTWKMELVTIVFINIVENKWDHTFNTLNVLPGMSWGTCCLCKSHSYLSPHLFSTSSFYFSHYQLPLLRTSSLCDIIPYVAPCLHRQELSCVAQTCFICGISFVQ